MRLNEDNPTCEGDMNVVRVPDGVPVKREGLRRCATTAFMRHGITSQAVYL